jgi:hypothetical protein
MSKFEVPVVRVSKVTDHENADRLSLVYFNGFITISAKLDDGSHRYKVGDLVVYVPEGAIVPEYLLRQGFWDSEKEKGILAGTKGNRVKAKSLRGVISQGIMFPVEYSKKFEGDEGIPTVFNDTDGTLIVCEGTNVAEFLGIQKWEPEIPTNFAGDVINVGTHNTVDFDIENLQKYPDTFLATDDVVVTEKLHGTCAIYGWLGDFDDADLYKNNMYSSSKGMASKGLVFKFNQSNQERNLYTRMGVELKIFDQLELIVEVLKKKYTVINKVVLLGEIFGRGVQDLHYGLGKPSFRAFEIFVDAETAGGERFIGWVDNYKYELMFFGDIDPVPILYRGKFDLTKMEELRTGEASIGGGHVKEGVVITRFNDDGTRTIMKFINPSYLTRKGEVTEFN